MFSGAAPLPVRNTAITARVAAPLNGKLGNQDATEHYSARGGGEPGGVRGLRAGAGGGAGGTAAIASP